MKIALCDDSAYDLELLKKTISENSYIREGQIDLYTDGNDLLKNIQNGEFYDIFFLDIEMPEINGITLAHMLRLSCPSSVIVFLTSYPQYAIDGYGCEALRYLLKPCNTNDVKTTLDRAFQIVEERTHFISVKIQNKTIGIRLNNLYMVECCNRHLLFHTENEVIEAVGTISSIYDKLKYYGFLQVHQGYIVNMDKIKNLKNDLVLLENEKTAPIGIRRKFEVYSEYSKYLERH